MKEIHRPGWIPISALDPKANDIRAFSLSDTPMPLTCGLKMSHHPRLSGLDLILALLARGV